MAELWASFARNGVPATPAVPDWPRYDLTDRATLVLDAPCRVERDPRGETGRLWMEIAGAA
jgi:para-nitrobenzyl esterase